MTSSIQAAVDIGGDCDHDFLCNMEINGKRPQSGIGGTGKTRWHDRDIR